RTSPWAAPSLMPGINTTQDEYEPCLISGGLALYLTAGANADLWRATRPTAADPFGPLIQVAELASGSMDSSAHVNAGELVVVFHSSRSGAGNKLYRGIRDTI